MVSPRVFLGGEAVRGVLEPAWKRRYAIKAVRLRRKLTNKALAHKLGVNEHTIGRWARKV